MATRNFISLADRGRRPGWRFGALATSSTKSLNCEGLLHAAFGRRGLRLTGRPEVACAGLLLRRQRTPHGSAGRGAGRGAVHRARRWAPREYCSCRRARAAVRPAPSTAAATCFLVPRGRPSRCCWVCGAGGPDKCWSGGASSRRHVMSWRASICPRTNEDSVLVGGVPFPSHMARCVRATGACATVARANDACGLAE